MITNTLIAKILDMTPQGVGKWRKEQRPIISLLEKYFTKEECNEFLENRRIERLELIKNLSIEEIKELLILKYNPMDYNYDDDLMTYNEELYGKELSEEEIKAQMEIIKQNDWISLQETIQKMQKEIEELKNK